MIRVLATVISQFWAKIIWFMGSIISILWTVYWTLWYINWFAGEIY